MSKAVVEDWGRFTAFLAAQPLCVWAAKKQQEIAAGRHDIHAAPGIRPPSPPKNDNADLAAALASMA